MRQVLGKGELLVIDYILHSTKEEFTKEKRKHKAVFLKFLANRRNQLNSVKCPDSSSPPLVSVLEQTEVIGAQGAFILILTEKGGFVR